MKICTQCKINRCKSEFRPRVESRDGLHSNCKQCGRLNATKYSRTIKGVIGTIYRTQKSSSKHRLMPLPSYSKQWLTEWLLNQKLFHKLYNGWVESEYDKYMKPSVDRKDDELSYTSDNIQLMTWQENKDKYDSDRISGVDKKQNKQVIQYSIDGNLLKSYHSLSNASIDTKISESCISNCCNGKIKTARGFIWKYAKV